MKTCTINVLVDWPNPSAETHSIKSTNLKVDYRIIYLPLPRNSFLFGLDNIIFKLPPEQISSQAIIIRLHKSEQTRLSKNSTPIIDLKNRFPNKSIYYLIWSNDSYKLIHERNTPKIEFENPTKFIEDLRQIELLTYANYPGVILPNDDDYHYEGPNKRHYERFLRVNDAFRTKDILDSFSFWLLPFANDSPILLLDTSGLLPLAFDFISYCLEFDYVKGRNWLGKIESLKNYDEDIDSFSNRLRQYHPSDSKIYNAISIISAKGSGNIAKKIKQVAEETSIKHTKSIFLYGTSSQEIQDVSDHEIILCKLDSSFIGYKDSCPLCAKGSTPISIDQYTYNLKLAAAQSTVTINISDTEKIKPFVDSYKGLNIFRLHKTRNNNQHHMIDVNIIPLLSDKLFTSKLDKILAKYSTIDFILAPTHEEGKVFCKYLQNKLNIPVIHKEHNELGKLSHSEVERFKNAENILIVDDVVITGTRLQNYKEALGTNRLVTDKTKIHFLGAVARPNSISTYNGIKEYTFHQGKNHFNCVEEIILPNFGEEKCPWCQESKMIERFIKSDSKNQRAKLIQRLNHLKSTKDGISTDLFLPWGKDLAAPTHTSVTTIYTESNNEVDIFVSVAGTIQFIRDNKKLNRENSMTTLKNIDFNSTSKTFDSSKTFEGRYWELFVIASIIRSSEKFDIYSYKVEQSIKQVFKYYFQNNDNPKIRSEILFAMYCRKLPSIEIDESIWNTGDEDYTAMFKKLLYSR